MKISVDDKELWTITDIDKDILRYNIDADKLDDAVKYALFSILNHKYEACFKRLKAEWLPKLAANGVESIPTDKDAFAQLVFAQPNYKDRSARDLEAEQV